MIKTSDFDYYLPPELIAQKPAQRRDWSRLLVIHRKTKELEHRHFYEILAYLEAGDLLVLNNTKVFPARLFGKKEKTGGKVEILLLKKCKKNTWEALVRPGKRIQAGTIIGLKNGVSAKSIEKIDNEKQLLEFNCDDQNLFQLGKIPLPPYIYKQNDKKLAKRYQTVFAQKIGATAAPTAGLHFTRKILNQIKRMGIDIKYITLHTGYGTFKPIRTEYLNQHRMDTEYYEISNEVISAIRKAQEASRRVIVVGTTTVRCLESYANSHKKSGETSLFIHPGYKFKIVDALLTNFHLPKSTLLALVSTLAGKNLVLKAYAEAINLKYRFYSFGDACLIL